MSDRPKITVKPQAPARNPLRRPVRALTAPRPPAVRGPSAAAKPPEEPRPRHEKPPAARPAADRPRRAQPAAAGRTPRPLRADPQAASARPTTPEPRPPAAPSPAGVRISKLITDRGIASRREADDWISAGWVSVDGRPVVLGQRAAADAVIDIHPLAHTAQATRVTVLMHKPIGFVSGQAEDGHEPAAKLFTAANRWAGDASDQRFHPGQHRGLAPAGRLDIDSTGLLVLTQDGRIARQLIGDETRVEKEYLVRVLRLDGGPLAEVPLDRLRHGLELDGVALRPARVSWQNEDQLRMVLREGRKRQIRRMCELVGLKVVGLKRVRIGSIVLGPLPPGQWRYLGAHERF
jgi:23S rRNA pseudouridine2604 synthase